jgi:GDP-D-mannose dehydratase
MQWLMLQQDSPDDYCIATQGVASDKTEFTTRLQFCVSNLRLLGLSFS